MGNNTIWLANVAVNVASIGYNTTVSEEKFFVMK
jgi:hypothetical protein